MQMDREPELKKSSGAPLWNRSQQPVASGTRGSRRPSPRWRGRSSSDPGRRLQLCAVAGGTVRESARLELTRLARRYDL